MNLGQAAKLHPCLYDYDAFWPVHDHLKRHLVSTRDKYSYLDPELVALYDAEAAARGEVRPPLRKKRRTLSRNQRSASDPRSLSLSPSEHNDEYLAIDVDRSPEPELWPLQQPLGVQSNLTTGRSTQQAIPRRPLDLGHRDVQARQLQPDSGGNRVSAEDRASATRQVRGTGQRASASSTTPPSNASLPTKSSLPVRDLGYWTVLHM